jgi:hypothetical protein
VHVAYAAVLLLLLASGCARAKPTRRSGSQGRRTATGPVPSAKPAPPPATPRTRRGLSSGVRTPARSDAGLGHAGGAAEEQGHWLLRKVTLRIKSAVC